MPIQKITIKNFRSIKNAEIETNQLTTFVGHNDAGKSNILRALNLFFNGKTDPDVAFNFERDYCKFANIGAKQAPEIAITLTIFPPDTYGGAKEITWKKVWRVNGLHLERCNRGFTDKTKIPSRSKINNWLDKIKFKYIPAIKDKDYFKSLMGELYQVLSDTLENELQKASKDFTKGINKNINPVLKNILDKLQIDSSIDLPDDLINVFQSLVFKSKDKGVALEQRGDGIKVRHIPIVLSFLANQDNALKIGGSPSYTHIWGYEEPENNLEIIRAIELGNDFIYYSKKSKFSCLRIPLFFIICTILIS